MKNNFDNINEMVELIQDELPECESKILIDRNFNLVDGYSSMKIAHLKGIEKVPVYFVD